MRIFGDRPAIGTKINNFFVDEYTYASLLANNERAEQCIGHNNIEWYYSKEGWTMLLLYYIDCIELMIEEWPQAITYIDVIEYNKLLIIDSKAYIKERGFRHQHVLPIDNDLDICHFTIQAIKILRTIFDMECKLDYLKVEYLKLRNLETHTTYNVDTNKKFIKGIDGNNKQKTNKTRKGEMEEAY